MNNKTKKVWTNIMILSINEGLKNNYFTLNHTTFVNGEKVNYDFFNNNLSFHVNANDIGHEEIAFHVYVNWNNNGKYKIYDIDHSLNTYDIYVHGWLERKTDYYLMEFNTASIDKKRNKYTMQLIENWNIPPTGYKTSGKFIC
jgi:hypothetical protein